jgi:TatD DNase family protein
MLYNFHTHLAKNEGFEILNYENGIDLKNNYYSYGIHPKDSEKEEFNKEILFDKNCLALGEIGLDKLISVPLDKQIEVFSRQIEFSEKHQFPVIIHCVKAWNEIILVKKKLAPKQKWIFHGFSKTNLVEEVLKNDLIFGIGTRILFDEKLQSCLQQIPINSILLETDADEKNTLISVYQKVAELKNISLQKIKKQIEENFRGTFNHVDFENLSQPR